MTGVMSNTSPLTNLAAIGQFDLLRRLYGDLLIAEAVWEELNAGGQAWPGREEVVGATWIARRAVVNRPLVTALRERLDPGEAETIALAVECPPAFILMDEKEGRHAAHRFGLKTVGVVGVLIEAKARGLIAEVGPLLERLRQEAGFYLSDRVIRDARTLCGEL
jgi:predicted nucleic acid-binding protein